MNNPDPHELVLFPGSPWFGATLNEALVFAPPLVANAMRVSAGRPNIQVNPNDDPIQWDSIDDLVQSQLQELTKELQRCHPELVWRAGRTSGRTFPLFSYRSYDQLDGQDTDPIIVGVTFTLSVDMVTIAADISGEESGKILFEVEPITRHSPSDSDIRREASRVAAMLAAQVDIVDRALCPRV